MLKFLLAGGSGMIGSKLVKKLKQNNIDFVFLSTQKKTNSLNNSYHWNPDLNFFPEIDLKDFDAVINFCGAGIFNHRITSERKQILLDSRVKPIQTLNNAFKNQGIRAPIFVSLSATGYYENMSPEWLNENSAKGDGFISDLVEQWEKAIFESTFISEKRCALRTGIVLSDTGGFLDPIIRTLNNYIGSVPGSGKQMVSWIHVDDLCDMILFAINNKMEGIYNATAPHPENLQIITQKVADLLKKPLFLPNVPSFVLKFFFGSERQKLILTDQKIEPQKMLECGFQFKYPEINSALEDLLK